MTEVFIVLPDLADSKVEALCELSGVNVLVSYSIFIMKPSALGRLRQLRECTRLLMLDSGAYHHAKGEVYVDVKVYARFAERYGGLFDYIVAPDVPGEPQATLERTVRFMQYYKGSFVPVLQPPYLRSFIMLAEAGALERAPMPGYFLLVGLGGLLGRKLGSIERLREVLGEAERLGLDIRFHVFGAGARLLRSLAKRGLINSIYSIDSGAWLAEIMYRRRELGARGEAEVNAAAIRRYLERLRGIGDGMGVL